MSMCLLYDHTLSVFVLMVVAEVSLILLKKCDCIPPLLALCTPDGEGLIVVAPLINTADYPIIQRS